MSHVLIGKSECVVCLFGMDLKGSFLFIDAYLINSPNEHIYVIAQEIIN